MRRGATWSISRIGVRGIIAMIAMVVVMAVPARGSEANLPRYIDEDEFRLRGPYCGITAVYAAARYHRLGDPDQYRRFRAERVDPQLGSSLAELNESARDMGLAAAPTRGLTIDDLVGLTSPAVLHVKSDVESPDFDHWVLFTGVTEDGAFLIVNAPSRPVRMTPDELAPLWDGSALLTGADAARAMGGWTWYGGIAVACVGLIGSRLLRGRENYALSSPTRFSTRRPLGVAALQVTAVLGVATMVAGVVHTTGGYVARPEARRQVEASRAYAFAPRFTLADVTPATAERGFLLVDARSYSDYLAGHVPGTANVPPQLDGPAIDDFLASIAPGTEIRIYCQSSGCPLSERLASRLWARGWTSIALSRDGFEDWSAQWPGESVGTIFCPLPAR